MPSPSSPIFFQIGPLVVRWYGLLIISGAVAGAYIASLEARRKNENLDHVWNLLTWGLICGILGARLYHVLSSPAGSDRGFAYYFITHPWTTLSLFGVAIPFPSALMIWEGGIGIYGGLIGGLLAVWLYTRRHQLNFWRWLDILALGLLLAQAIGRWGNFFNQELYGPPTDLLWGILITNVSQRIPPYHDLTVYPLQTTFHPVFLYESLWNLLGFVLVVRLGRKYAPKLLDGDLLSFYLIWYPTGRILVEMLRPDAWTISGIPTAQLVSGFLILLGLALLIDRHRHPERATRPDIPEYSTQTPPSGEALT